MVIFSFSRKVVDELSECLAINWARKIVVDPKGNMLFTSWEGVARFDGSKWSVMNKKNSKLPSDRVLGVFVDSKDLSVRKRKIDI